MDISGLAKKPVVKTGLTDRALGRFIKIPLVLDSTASTQDLAADLFQSLWMRKPELLPDDKIDPMRSVNNEILKKYQEDTAFESTRRTVSANLSAAIACTQTTWAAITRDDYLKSALEEQKQADEKEQQAVDAEEQADRNEQAADKDEQDNGQPTPRSEQLRQNAESLRQQAEALRNAAQAQAQAAAAKISDRLDKPLGKAAIANAMKDGREEGEQVDGFMKSWGLNPGDIDAEDVEKLLDFKKSADVLSNMVGRMKGVAKRQIERVKQQSIGPVSEPAYTKDILHLFPTELAKLSPQAPAFMRVQAVNSLFNGAGLLGWRPKITGERGGHVHIIVDRSTSMEWGNPKPLTVAKSIALGVAMAAKEDANRNWELYYFNERSPAAHPSVTSKSDWKSVMRWSQAGVSGGTDFSAALDFAEDRIRNLKGKDEVGYDVLFLTDEDSYIDDEVYAAWIALKAETGVRLHVVSINCTNGGNERLRTLADTHITTSAIANQAGEIVEIVIDKIARDAFGGGD